MIRRVGEAFRAGIRYTHRPGAYVILPRGRDLLVTHQEAPTPEFQLPGGGIDPGEGAIAALHREVLEETGWRIAAPKRLGVYRRFVFMPDYDLWAEKVCHIYIARPVRRLGAPSEPDHTAVWMNAFDARHHVASDGDQLFIDRYLGHLNQRR